VLFVLDKKKQNKYSGDKEEYMEKVADMKCIYEQFS
jgi:hypothetical protein